MTLVYVYGSGECEQLGLGDDAPPMIKKPRKPSIFDIGNVIPARSIVSIICGGMHTVALASNGSVYTWGCNDEGALGRTGAENTPLLVDGSLNEPVTNISAGDSHSIAYNTQTNKIFYWGCYRNAQSGKTFGVQPLPTQIGGELFNSKKMIIKKVASGAQHTLALSECGKVYGWGDAESGKIGRMLNTRNKDAQALKIEKVGAKNAIDVFCGNQHSFYINDKNQVFSWGLNNHGQLGLGNKFNSSVPARVHGLDPFQGDYVVELAGGEHHSIARTKDGAIYCFGRNDEGQIGCGDTYGEWRKKKAIADEQARQEKEAEEARKAEEAAAEAQKAEAEPVQENGGEANGTANAEMNGEATQIVAPPAKKSKPVRPKKTKAAAEEDLKYIFYFHRPELVESLWKWDLEEGDDVAACRKPATQVYAAAHCCYAVCGDEVYSWGFGENYVLGNRADENEFKPYKLDPRMFENNKVIMIGCGTQHTVALTHDGPESVIPELQITNSSKAAVVTEVEQTGTQAKPQTPGAAANPPSQSNQQQASQASAAAGNQEAEPAADVVIEAEPEHKQWDQEDNENKQRDEEEAERGEDPEDQDDVKISKKRTRDEFEAQNQGEAVAQEVIQSQQSNTKRLKIEENQISSPTDQVAEESPAQQQNQGEEEPAE